MQPEATFPRQFQLHDGIWVQIARASRGNNRLDLCRATVDLARRFPEASEQEISQALLSAASEAEVAILESL